MTIFFAVVYSLAKQRVDVCLLARNFSGWKVGWKSHHVSDVHLITVTALFVILGDWLEKHALLEVKAEIGLNATVSVELKLSRRNLKFKLYF